MNKKTKIIIVFLLTFMMIFSLSISAYAKAPEFTNDNDLTSNEKTSTEESEEVIEVESEESEIEEAEAESIEPEEDKEEAIEESEEETTDQPEAEAEKIDDKTEKIDETEPDPTEESEEEKIDQAEEVIDKESDESQIEEPTDQSKEPIAETEPEKIDDELEIPAEDEKKELPEPEEETEEDKGESTNQPEESEEEKTNEPEEVIEDQEIKPGPIIVSLMAEVEPSDDNYTNGDTIDYEITIKNDGNTKLNDISISDQLRLNKNIASLSPGETIIINGKYTISLHNEIEEMENNINIYTDYDGKHLSMNLNFKANIYVPKGSIIISNNVDNLEDDNLEFDIFVKGPEGSEYVVSLQNQESEVIKNLPIGNYSIIPISPMNYNSNHQNINVSITQNKLNHKKIVSYYHNDKKGFYDEDNKQLQGYKINSRDITYDNSSAISNAVEERKSNIFLDLSSHETEEKEEVLTSSEIEPDTDKDENINTEDKKDIDKVEDEDIEGIEDIKVDELSIKPDGLHDEPISKETIPTKENEEEDINITEEMPIIKDLGKESTIKE